MKRSTSASTYRRSFAVCAITAFVAGSVLATGGIASAQPQPMCAAATCSVTYAQSDGAQYWDVPTGVTSVTITAAGGSGGNASGTDALGGAGGLVVATVPVVPGTGLTIFVGAAGENGSNTAPAAGGYGGGGSAGSSVNTLDQAGGAGGGGTFVYEPSVSALPLAVAGGGGGAAGGLAYGTSIAATGGAGTDAPASDLSADPLSGAGATTTADGLGAPNPPSAFAGQDGSGSATFAPTFGTGGAGASNDVQVEEGTAGGGGGGYFGGGGGGSDTGGKYDGAGGGGAGYLAPSAVITQQSTHQGDGTVTITYAGIETTTSGVLRDAVTGAAIPDSCVVFSPAAFPGETNYTSVDGDGSWSFTSTDSGPFDLAFYTTANGDCSQAILPNPVPSWYVDQPLTGTDEHVITPPSGASTVAAGTSGVIACLGATALPTAACAVPPVALSGTVRTVGNAPVADVCVFALAGNGDGLLALTDAAGHWSMSGLPATFAVVIAFVPNFSAPSDPCDSGNGQPPVPAAGALQPVLYDNVFLDLGDASFFDDPQAWALAHGATLITGPTLNIQACLTNAAGNVVPRPSCTTSPVVAQPAQAALDADPLAATGMPTIQLIGTGVLLVLLGMVMLMPGARRRR